jgi:hypothetical protein
VCWCIGDCIAHYLADFDAACLVKKEHVGGGWVVDASREGVFVCRAVFEGLTYCHKSMLRCKSIASTKLNVAKIKDSCA